MKCDSCHKQTWSLATLGCMPHDRKKDRNPASLCDDCTDTCPCGSKGYWNDGHLTCQHGFVYDIDYCWVTGSYREVAARARPIFHFLKRKWWSYLCITNSKHQNYLI